MSEQYITLESTTTTTHNFTKSFSSSPIQLDGDWEVAVAQIYVPRVSFLAQLRRQFSSSQEIARWKFFYDTSGAGSATTSIEQAVTASIFDQLGEDVTKAEVLQAIFSEGFNKAVKAVKADSTVSAAYWQDSSDHAMYQTFEWEGDDLVLKSSGPLDGSDAYLRLHKNLANVMYLTNRNYKLTRFLYPKSSVNYDFKGKVTWQKIGNEYYFYGNVDWVFLSARSTPWKSSSLELILHEDIHCDAVSSQSNSGQTVLHANVPFGGITITPPVRNYLSVASSSLSSIRVWITVAGTSTTLSSGLHQEKTHVVLHFRKKETNTMGAYRRDHPTMVI